MSSGPAALLTPCRHSLRRAGRSLANPIPGTARVPCPSPFTLGGLRSPRGCSLLEARMGALRAAAVSSDLPPAHPVSAATRSQGLAPLPATERRDYGAGPECGGLGTLIFWEGKWNQGVGGAGSADNRRIVSGHFPSPLEGEGGPEGRMRGETPRIRPDAPRAVGRPQTPQLDCSERLRSRTSAR
jgi:hypothetical protein